MRWLVVQVYSIADTGLCLTGTAEVPLAGLYMDQVSPLLLCCVCAALCCAVLCCAVLCCAVLRCAGCDALRHSVPSCAVVPRSPPVVVVLCCALPCDVLAC
jgi:hypothetical protein